jgi:hypothetical protein
MIRRTPRAILDLLEHAEWIGADSGRAADRFLDAAEETFSFLLARLSLVG